MKVDLKEMCGGAMQEKFQNSFEKVMENLQDVNTPYKDKREIVIKLAFAQNEQRDNVIVDISVKEKLAPQGGVTMQLAVGKDLRTGKVIAEEYGSSQLKGQMSIDDGMEDDAETGKVVNFRKEK